MGPSVSTSTTRATNTGYLVLKRHIKKSRPSYYLDTVGTDYIVDVHLAQVVSYIPGNTATFLTTHCSGPARPPSKVASHTDAITRDSWINSRVPSKRLVPTRWRYLGLLPQLPTSCWPRSVFPSDYLLKTVREDLQYQTLEYIPYGRRLCITSGTSSGSKIVVVENGLFTDVRRKKLWSFVFTAVVASAAVWLYQYLHPKRDAISEIPLIGADIEDEGKRRMAFATGAKHMYQAGYRKFKNGVFRVCSPRGTQEASISTGMRREAVGRGCLIRY